MLLNCVLAASMIAVFDDAVPGQDREANRAVVAALESRGRVVVRLEARGRCAFGEVKSFDAEKVK